MEHEEVGKHELALTSQELVNKLERLENAAGRRLSMTDEEIQNAPEPEVWPCAYCDGAFAHKEGCRVPIFQKVEADPGDLPDEPEAEMFNPSEIKIEKKAQVIRLFRNILERIEALEDSARAHGWMIE